VNLTDRAEADRSVKYLRGMPTDAHTPTRVRASEELRQAALEQFSTVGFAASSLQQIADHAGYSKSSVLYHYSSKEALLEAAIGPAIDAMEELLGDFVESGRSAEARAIFIERFVDFLLGNRLAVHTFVNQGQSLRGIPVIERANVAIRGIADSICADDAPVVENIRFGVALAGAAYTLVAGTTFLDDDRRFEDVEVRGALITVLSELLLPADGRTTR
jgi:TetR/AcrR family transcriptional regulator